ncbi:MAG: single-stranded DNA-binding protein [Flavobacteriales bacterium]|nr:single-stranded DNA-binding protein [Flavobacteriales bacterium]
MKSLRNNVQLIGNLGADPKVKMLENGRKYALLSMATDEFLSDEKGKPFKNTEWHRVVAFGKMAEFIEKFTHKGKEVALEGKLVHRSYTDDTGKIQFISEVVADSMTLLGKKTEPKE